jgi:NifU-like protein
MWDYTDKVMDHFRNPRNVGMVDDPDGIGEVGSLACGDALKLTFKLGADGRIADARFQTFGCASAIASSSALTEMIRGMPLEQAEKVTNQDIADYLGGLPEQKMHCSVLGREALEMAIHNYRTGTKAPKKVLEGRVVCKCFGVTEEEIRRVIRDNSLVSAEQVTNYSKAGGGCGNCIPEIEKLIAQVQEERRKAHQPSASGKMTILQKVTASRRPWSARSGPCCRRMAETLSSSTFKERA